MIKNVIDSKGKGNKGLVASFIKNMYSIKNDKKRKSFFKR